MASVGFTTLGGASLVWDPIDGKPVVDTAVVCEGFASAHSKILRFKMMGLRLWSPSSSEARSPKSSDGPANDDNKDSRKARGIKCEREFAVDVRLEKETSVAGPLALDATGKCVLLAEVRLLPNLFLAVLLFSFSFNIASSFGLSLYPALANFSGYRMRKRSRKSVGWRLENPRSLSSLIRCHDDAYFSKPFKRFSSSCSVKVRRSLRLDLVKAPCIPISRSSKGPFR